MGIRMGAVVAVLCVANSAQAQPVPKGIRDLSGTYTALPIESPPTRPFEFFDRDFDLNWSQIQRDQLILGRVGQEREGNVLRIQYQGVLIHHHYAVISRITSDATYKDFMSCGAPIYAFSVQGTQTVTFLDGGGFQETNGFVAELPGESPFRHFSESRFSIVFDDVKDNRPDADALIVHRWMFEEFGTGEEPPCSRDFQFDAVSHFMTKSGVAPFGDTSDILGAAAARNTGLDVVRGYVSLYAQDELLPTPGDPGAYLSAQRDKLRFQRRVQIDEDGKFAFRGVPLFRSRGAGQQGAYVPAVYTLVINGAESDGPAGPVAYRTRVIPNVVPLPMPMEQTYPLDVDILFSTKRSLIARISGLAPTNYGPVEAQMASFLDLIEGSETDAQREGISRSLWAERVILEGAENAQSLLKDLTDVVASIVADILGDLLQSKSKDLARGQTINKNLSRKIEELPEAKRTAFKAQTLSRLRQDVATKRQLSMATEAETAGTLKKLLGFTLHALKAAFKANIEDPMDLADANAALDGFGLLANAILDVMASQTKGAAFAGVGKKLVEETVKVVGPAAFDNRITSTTNPKLQLQLPADFPSYTRLTRDVVQYSVDRSTAWSTVDATSLANDQIDARNHLLALTAGSEAAQNRFRLLKVSNDALGTAETVFGAVSVFGPQFKATETGLKIAAAASQIGNAAQLFHHVYSTIPTGVERGVYAAYGAAPPPAGGTFGDVVDGSPLNTNLEADRAAALTALDEAVDDFEAAVNDDDMGALFEHLLDEGPNLYSAWRGYRRAVGAFQLQAEAGQISDDDVLPLRAVNSLAANEVAAAAFQDVFVGGLQLADVAFSEGVAGPADPVYLAERRVVLERIDDLRRALDGAEDADQALLTALQSEGIEFAPGVEVTDVGVTAVGGTDNFVSTSGQQFRITATVRNVGSVAVQNVGVELSASNDTFSVVGDAEAAVGALDPDDGAAGGSDEASIEFTVRFDGTLDDVFAYFDLDPTQSGATPTSFFPGGAQVSIVVSPEVYDPDGDGMPTLYEMENGQDPMVDDATADMDSDGLTNAEEFEFGTDPRDRDSDGDTLSDGEEQGAGQDGFRTDPLEADTDGDGTRDDADGAPLDFTRTDAVTPPGEPAVQVATTEVELSESSASVQIAVDNAGAGRLYWSARADTPVVLVSPDRTLREGAGLLEIGLAPDFDFSGFSELTARVVVADVVGADTDVQTIQVRIVGTAGGSPDAGADLGPGDVGPADQGGGTDMGPTDLAAQPTDLGPADMGARPDMGAAVGPNGGGDSGGCTCWIPRRRAAPSWGLIACLMAVIALGRPRRRR